MASGKALQDLYQSFEDLFNEIYEAKFQNGPQVPRFSLLRLFTSQWSRKVFLPLESSLLGSALGLLTALRSDRLLKSQISLDHPYILTLMKYPPSQDYSGFPRPQYFAQVRSLPKSQFPAAPTALFSTTRSSDRKQQRLHEKSRGNSGSGSSLA